MNYLFRPTPVVVLGRDMGADVVALSQSPAGMMAGTPRASSRPSRSLATQGSPWIVRSGSMASFGTLGQDPSSFVDPSFVDPGIVDTGSTIDWSSAVSIAPNLPAPIPPDFPVAPELGLPQLYGPILPVTVTAPIAPSSGAGPTGQSIPGTQVLNPAVQAGTGILNTIANFLKPSPAAPARSVTLPGVGVNPRQPAPSFWSTSSVLPGIPNATVILGGAAVVLLLFALSSGGKK